MAAPEPVRVDIQYLSGIDPALAYRVRFWAGDFEVCEEMLRDDQFRDRAVLLWLSRKVDSFIAYDASGATNCEPDTWNGFNAWYGYTPMPAPADLPRLCSQLWSSTEDLGTIHSPAVANGRIFFAGTRSLGSSSSPGELYAFAADGPDGQCSGSPRFCQPVWTGALGLTGSGEGGGGTGYGVGLGSVGTLGHGAGVGLEVTASDELDVGNLHPLAGSARDVPRVDRVDAVGRGLDLERGARVGIRSVGNEPCGIRPHARAREERHG